jgi:enoyl-CoA hydratase/carnithine racemase
VPTVAAVNGHAFAAGGMMMLAHDFRVMRSDRGYFCLNEVDLGLPLAPAWRRWCATGSRPRTCATSC